MLDQGPSHFGGSHITHGMAKGSSKSPDSPESAGFFEALKNSQVKSPTKVSRKAPAAIDPAFDLRRTSRLMAAGLRSG